MLKMYAVSSGNSGSLKSQHFQVQKLICLQLVTKKGNGEEKKCAQKIYSFSRQKIYTHNVCISHTYFMVWSQKKNSPSCDSPVACNFQACNKPSSIHISTSCVYKFLFHCVSTNYAWKKYGKWEKGIIHHR